MSTNIVYKYFAMEISTKIECGKILRNERDYLCYICLHCGIEFISISDFIGHTTDLSDSSFQGKELKVMKSTELTDTHSTNGIQISSINGVEISSANDVEISSTNGVDISSTNGVDISSTNGVKISSTNGVEISSVNEFSYIEVIETETSINNTSKSLKDAKVSCKEQTKKRLHTWSCDICSEVKTTQECVSQSVKRHMIRFHNATCKLKKKPKIHHCNLCGKSFRIAQYLRDHIAVHNRQTLYQCSNCDYRSAAKSSIYRHNRIYHGNYNETRKYVCHVCGLKLETAQNLISHTNRHLGLKPYSCDECGKEFASKNYIKVHKRYHLGVRPFKCTECNESFVLNSHLIRHKRVHAGTLKNIECNYCNKKFDSQSKMREHMIVHTMTRDFSCGFCNKKFARNRAMKSHIKRVHKESLLQ